VRFATIELETARRLATVQWEIEELA